MNDPATESQLNILRQFHYEPDHPLSRVEAAQLIGDLRRHKDVPHPTAANRVIVPPAEPEWRRFRVDIEKARKALAEATISRRAEFEHALAGAIRNRQEFWIDTCRDPVHMQTQYRDVWELYMKHGCRFVPPTHAQVQEILDALDSAMPDWDRSHAELFYRTLELNFPALVRQF